MNLRAVLLGILWSLCLCADVKATAQTVPVKIVLVGLSTDDKGQQMAKSLRDTIQLSGRFSIYDGDIPKMPSSGILIKVFSIEVKNKTDGSVMGSAITIQSLRQSDDLGYFKELYLEMWMLPSNDPTADIALRYIARLGDRLDHPVKSAYD